MEIKIYRQIWEEYNSLEGDFKNFIDYIPIEDEHLDTWSLKLGNILLILGSVLDSFFQVAIEDSYFDSIPKIKNIRSKSKKNITDYRKVFESYYKLSEKYVYIRSMERRIQPFVKWKQNQHLEWWRAYQLVKHNRFKNKKEAKLRHVLDGMAALFLLNVVHIPIRIVLARLRLWESAYNQSWNWNFIADSVFNNKEPIGEHDVFLFKTDLFGYILEGTSKETKNPEIWHKLLSLVREPMF